MSKIEQFWDRIYGIAFITYAASGIVCIACQFSHGLMDVVIITAAFLVFLIPMQFIASIQPKQFFYALWLCGFAWFALESAKNATAGFGNVNGRIIVWARHQEPHIINISTRMYLSNSDADNIAIIKDRYFSYGKSDSDWREFQRSFRGRKIDAEHTRDVEWPAPTKWVDDPYYEQDN